MIIIKNKFIPFGGYKILNFFGILFVKGDNVDEVDINHESIHTEQIKELAVVTAFILLILSFICGFSQWWILTAIPAFYVWYCLEYIFVRFFHYKQNEAYHDISLEEEAYANETFIGYLKVRKHFAWFKYLLPRSNV